MHQPSKLNPDFPRRAMVPEWTAAEHTIAAAVDAVERAGAHPLLTEAVVLLGQAKDKVADYVELSVVVEDAPDRVLPEAPGPHYVLVGYNDNGTPCAALTVYAASAGLDTITANGVLMFHDAGHPHVKSVEAVSWPARAAGPRCRYPECGCTMGCGRPGEAERKAAANRKWGR